MSGAMRQHAPSSTRLMGLVSATALTLAMGYVFANGMGVDINRLIPDPIIYVALPDPAAVEPLLTDAKTLDTQTDLTAARDAIDIDVPTFMPEDAQFVSPGPPPPYREKASSQVNVAPARAPLRTSAKMLPAASPLYPANEMRKAGEGAASHPPRSPAAATIPFSTAQPSAGCATESSCQRKSMASRSRCAATASTMSGSSAADPLASPQ
jgi:hypothetical protein